VHGTEAGSVGPLVSCSCGCKRELIDQLNMAVHRERKLCLGLGHGHADAGTVQIPAPLANGRQSHTWPGTVPLCGVTETLEYALPFDDPARGA